MCNECVVKAIFDDLCRQTADAYVKEMTEKHGPFPQIVVSLIRVGHFITKNAVDAINLDVEDRRRMVVDFEHTIMGHPGAMWDCPPCAEKSRKLSKDNVGH